MNISSNKSPKVQVRLTRSTYEEIRRDLDRPHGFAAERVGFATGKLGNTGGDPLLVLVDSYEPVSDEKYVNDPTTGARINSAAIREAMQLVLDRQCGVFHVHLHPHRGRPRLSKTDLRELPNLVASISNAEPSQPHGLLLLSYDHCIAFILYGRYTSLIEASRVSVVGVPMEIWE